MTDNIGKAVTATAKKASDVNEKYKVTDNIGKAVASGLDQVSKLAGDEDEEENDKNKKIAASK